MLKLEDHKFLIGKDYTFSDGIILRVIQIKQRETALWVTYEHVYSGAMPRRFSETLEKFMETYGHLYKNENNEGK